MESPKTELRRRLTLVPLALYGLGTTIGAGIYALVGEMAATAGMQMPIAFLVAAVLAGLTGLSFAELSARYPLAAGEAVYVREGFNVPALALAVGLLAVAAGTVSAAGIVNGFVGYVQSLIEVHRAIAIVGLVLVLAGFAAWGIGESVAAAAVITVIELGGLVLVIAFGGVHLADFPARAAEFLPTWDAGVWGGIFAGTFLAFYAFIGFEDIVNVAEETKDATRTVPRAILLTLAVTAVAYILISVVAVLAVPLAELSGHGAPLKLIFAQATGGSGALIGIIGILAMVNGALIQLIKSARVLYGLARQGVLPAWLGSVNAVTRTPLKATALVASCILVLALWFRLAGLAEATSVITLVIFSLVNLALLRIKRRDPAPDGIPIMPKWIPVAGFVVSFGFLIGEIRHLIG